MSELLWHSSEGVLTIFLAFYDGHLAGRWAAGPWTLSALMLVSGNGAFITDGRI